MTALPSPTTRHTPRPQSGRQAGVVIDGARLLSVEGEGRCGADALLAWVQSYPRHGDIHVYLPRARDRAQARRLQTNLQSLGCIVTQCLAV